MTAPRVGVSHSLPRREGDRAPALRARPARHLPAAGPGALRGRPGRQLRRPTPARRSASSASPAAASPSPRSRSWGCCPSAATASPARCIYDGTDLLTLSDQQMRDRRGKDIAMVFQDPLSSLNPVIPIGLQVTEVLERHRGMSRKAATPVARDLLDRVGIPDPDRRLTRLPAPALRRHAPARAHRDRPGLPAAAAHRRRADDRPRRDDPGADPRPAQGARAGHRHGADHDHPRPRRRRRPLRRGQRPLRRPDRRAGRAARAVRPAAPPLHARAARLDPPARRPPRPAAARRSRARCPTTCRGRAPARSPRAARSRSSVCTRVMPELVEDDGRALRCHNPVEESR